MTRAHHDWIDRLGNEIHPSCGQGSDLVGWLGAGGDKNHRNIRQRRVGLEAATDFDAIHTGHDHIQKNQIRRKVVTAKSQRLLASCGHEYFVISVKNLVQRLDIDWLVIHYQQAWALRQGGNSAVPKRSARGH